MIMNKKAQFKIISCLVLISIFSIFLVSANVNFTSPTPSNNSFQNIDSLNYDFKAKE